ncbi:MAG: type II toxin-antitoxin system VapC family toxin [Kiritimatiellae bacterium]|nr:type II toxin-antitoxin system VapC family toxin [Kiritimatiellia bacterium]
MLLLDTHAFVWLASDLKKLPARARQAVRANAGALFLSSISGLEIGILVKRERLTLPVAPDLFIGRALEQHAVQELPVTWEAAYASSRLPDIHNDPFDRIIVATAHIHDMPILSKDRAIRQYPGTTVVWQ